MDKKKSHKNLLNISMIIVFSLLMVFLIVKDDFKGVIEVLKTTEWFFIVLALAIYSMKYILDAIILLVLTRKYKKDYTFKEACVNSMVGVFFSSITPSATGGQFSQMYVHEKQGVPVEKSGTVMIMTFVSYELVLVLYCLVTILFANGNVSPIVHIFGIDMNFVVLVIIGFVINAGGIFLILFAVYFNGVLKLIHRIINFLHRIHIIKHPESTIEKFDNKVILLRKEVKDIKGNFKYFISSVLLYVVRCTLAYCIPFFVALALHIPLQPRHFFIAIILDSYLTLINSFVPVPGASGGAEFFFALFFTSFFGDKTLMASGMLIWRFVTFYFGLLVGFLVTLNFNHKLQVNLFKEVNDDYKWFVMNKRYANSKDCLEQQDSNPTV